MNKTPDRYVPESRDYEQKDWLYEQYWGHLRSSREIADQCGVSHDTIRNTLREHGIPIRPPEWRRRTGPYDPRDDFVRDEDDTHDDTSQPDWCAIDG